MTTINETILAALDDPLTLDELVERTGLERRQIIGSAQYLKGLGKIDKVLGKYSLISGESTAPAITTHEAREPNGEDDAAAPVRRRGRAPGSKNKAKAKTTPRAKRRAAPDPTAQPRKATRSPRSSHSGNGAAAALTSSFQVLDGDLVLIRRSAFQALVQMLVRFDDELEPFRALLKAAA
jgi:hypothetical protein